jgi:hypothetical protein
MKKGICAFAVGIFLAGSLLVAFASAGEDPKITVLDPRGKPPSIPLVPMAPRLETLKGKTIYLVDIGFSGGLSLLSELNNWFAKNRPEVKTVLKKKRGPYMDDDPELWAEIKAKGDGVVMAVGH